jgi:ketosteroid isomerase-like protein
VSVSRQREILGGAMSEENVELARKTYAILNEVYLTGDPEPLRRHIQERADPECALVTTDITFESEWRGEEGILAFVADQMEALDRMWIRPDDYVDLGDRVIILLSWGGRAKQTGIEVEFSSAHVFTFRDGLAVRIHMYRDPVYGVNAESLRAFWEAWKPGEELPTFIFDPEVAHEDSDLPDRAAELDRIVGAGDRLVSIHHVQDEGSLAYVWTFRDGKVIHFRSYREPSEALQAAGLGD